LRGILPRGGKNPRQCVLAFFLAWRVQTGNTRLGMDTRTANTWICNYEIQRLDRLGSAKNKTAKAPGVKLAYGQKYTP